MKKIYVLNKETNEIVETVENVILWDKTFYETSSMLRIYVDENFYISETIDENNVIESEMLKI